MTRGRDISYGVCIYAFPLEQLAVRAFPPHDHLSHLAYYASALAATLLLARLSWVLVEKPAITSKARIIGAIARGVERLRLGAVRPEVARPS